MVKQLNQRGKDNKTIKLMLNTKILTHVYKINLSGISLIHSRDQETSSGCSIFFHHTNLIVLGLGFICLYLANITKLELHWFY